MLSLIVSSVLSIAPSPHRHYWSPGYVDKSVQRESMRADTYVRRDDGCVLYSRERGNSLGEPLNTVRSRSGGGRAADRAVERSSGSSQPKGGVPCHTPNKMGQSRSYISSG